MTDYHYTEKLDLERTDYQYLQTLAYELKGTVRRSDWLEALESGKYSQFRGAICDDARAPESFCCLGVAAVLAKLPFYLNGARMDSKDAGLLIEGMTEKDCDMFAIPLNDGAREIPLEADPRFNKGATFPEIAAFFRQRWDMPK